MWDTTGESDLQNADRLGNICRVTSVALFLNLYKIFFAVGGTREVRLSKRNYGKKQMELWKGCSGLWLNGYGQ